MASIQETKKRKNVVGSIYKITKAMGMISIAKTKKYSRLLESKKQFRDDTYRILNQMFEHEDILNGKLFKQRSISNSTLWIVITSESGFCGSYNSSVIKTLMKADKGKDDYYITIGKKGVSALRNKLKIETNQEYIDIEENLISKTSVKIAEEVVKKFIAEEIDNVKIISTKYINQMTFLPIVTTLLPLSKDNIEEVMKEVEIQDAKHQSKIEFEPSIGEILRNLLPQYMSSTILALWVESLLSENTSRRVAMENAKSNGEELLEALEIEYNKARQQKITQELTEIIAGAEADKEE